MEVYVVIHVAAAFDENSTRVPRDAAELISLSWCLVDCVTLEILPRHTLVVNPANTPVTSECSRRYNVLEDAVKRGLSFRDAVTQFDQKLVHELAGRDFLFVTVDIHSLRVMLPREARDKSVVLPVYLQHPRAFELFSEYLKWQKSHPEAMSYPSSCLNNLIVALGADVEAPQELPEPAEVVDVYAKILKLLVQKSLPAESHPAVLTKPYDTALDAKHFLAERSKILFLSNLPPDTTQPELESWFAHFGCRPAAVWALKNVESDPKNQYAKTRGISGFAIFAKHEEAAEALVLNGRVLTDRVVEVQASSTKVLDRAAELLNTFPPLKNRPRPGDWTCPSCGFSNFQRRIACFRCSFPAASAVAIQEQIYTTPVSGQDGSFRRAKPEGKVANNYRGYQDQYLGTSHVKNGGPYTSSYGHGYNHNTGGQRAHHSNSVPFRAGDWKCANESCQYHNFAKNLSCLKCGATKPSSVSGLQLHNNPGTSGGNTMSSGSHHSVNSTAAAIAAATASGQPLNFSRSFHGMQQPQPHHSRNGNGAYSPSSASPTNVSLYANHLQQLQMQQNKHQGSQYLPQHLALIQGHNQAIGAINNGSQNSDNSPKFYGQQASMHYRKLGDDASGLGIDLLNTQIESMSLNKTQEK